MGDKSRGRGHKKPTMTIKERRAEKRAQFDEAQQLVPRRKRDRA